MIKDREIDLTVNSKCDGREERNFQYRVKSCMEKLGIENRLTLSIAEEVAIMPWDTREIHSQNDLYRSENRVSRIDDRLSNEVGIPLRITSTNEIIVLGDMDYDEECDTYIIPEGWWESVEYAEEFSAVDDKVTHWMSLPDLPKEE